MGPDAAGGHGTSPDDTCPDDTSPEDAGTLEEGERVVLAVGSTYFHNGRVSPERYASDLAPSFLGAIAASHTLLRELFKEMGAPEGASIKADCDRWHLRYGSDLNQAQFSVDEQMPANGTGPAAPSRDRSGADGWVRGLVASRDADHAQALAAFEAEAAEAAEAGAPQRAAIAYRAAACGRTGGGPRRSRQPLAATGGQGVPGDRREVRDAPTRRLHGISRERPLLLEAGNLPLAHKCLSKAIAIGETLGYTESA